MFKKVCCAIMIVLIALPLFSPCSKAHGELLPGYEGGIQNDMEYQEFFVLTGEPVILKGTIKVNQGRMRDGKRQDRLTYKLQSEDKKITLSRNMTYDVYLEQDVNKQQVITVSKLTRFSENISVKGDGNRADRYTLQNCEINGSTITDMAPAVDHYSMNLGGKKVYAINRDEGTVTVELDGTGVGCEHAWGATETRNTTFVIDVNRSMTVSNKVYDVNWTGMVEVVQSFNKTRQLSYVENEPTQMSFKGGYLETITEESVARFNYSLPRFDNNGLPREGRNRSDEVEIKLSSVPNQRRTFIPKLLDISGHWAQADIERLVSLGIMEPKGQYFGPKANATRMDFARGLAQLTNIIERAGRLSKVEANLPRSRQNTPSPEIAVFDDIPSQGQDMKYVQSLQATGIMQGVGTRRFGPEQTLTRAQAVTAIIRALGLEHMAPNPPYSIGFVDDRDIPPWAKDAIYVAKRNGLAQGDSAGFFRPNDPMTKAEAAAFLNRFITYLQRDLKQDFRDRIINY